MADETFEVCEIPTNRHKLATRWGVFFAALRANEGKALSINLSLIDRRRLYGAARGRFGKRVRITGHTTDKVPMLIWLLPEESK